MSKRTPPVRITEAELRALVSCVVAYEKAWRWRGTGVVIRARRALDKLSGKLPGRAHRRGQP